VVSEPNGIKEINAKEIKAKGTEKQAPETEEAKKQKVSTETQKKTVKIHKSSKGLTILWATNCLSIFSFGIVKNADIGIGGVSYFMFGLAINALAKGQILDSIIFIVASIFTTLAKHRIPEGPIIQYIRQPTGIILADIREEIEEAKKTFRGE